MNRNSDEKQTEDEINVVGRAKVPRKAFRGPGAAILLCHLELVTVAKRAFMALSASLARFLAD